MRDMFGGRGRVWLAAQLLPTDERDTLLACLRHIDFFDAEITTIDRTLAEAVLGSAGMRRLLTLPGVNAVAAAALMSAVGDIGRLPTPRHRVSSGGPPPEVGQLAVDHPPS